jgi:hypothetical protein
MSACGTWPMSDAQVDASARDYYSMAADFVGPTPEDIHELFKHRGRWMVVYVNREVTRHRRKSAALAEVGRAELACGQGAAVLRRFRRDLVVRDEDLPGWRFRR